MLFKDVKLKGLEFIGTVQASKLPPRIRRALNVESEDYIELRVEGAIYIPSYSHGTPSIDYVNVWHEGTEVPMHATNELEDILVQLWEDQGGRFNDAI